MLTLVIETLTMSLSEAVTWTTVVPESAVSEIDVLYDGCSNIGLLSLISSTLIKTETSDVFAGSLISVA